MTTMITESSKSKMLEAVGTAMKKLGPPPKGRGGTTTYGSGRVSEAVRFGRRENGRVYVTHEWIVAESHDDDYLSRTGGLIQGKPTASATVEADTVDELLSKLA